MKTKPWSIIILSILHIIAPLGNLMINAKWAHHSIQQHLNIWFYLMPKYLLFAYLVLPVLAGVFIYICKKWSYWAYLLCLLLIFCANIYGFYTQPNWLNFVFVTVLMLADVLVVAYFVVPAVRNLYMDPKLRWWEAAPRYTFENSIDIDGSEGVGSIKNISEGGLFTLSSAAMEEGQHVKLRWVFENHTYDVVARVVYKSSRSVTDGYGLQFSHTPETQKALRMLCSVLRSRGQVTPDRKPGPEDSFIHWLKNLIMKREGLFPKR